ncbi:MAG: AI-2E family transporter [Saprospiraceae bacterium]|nr:AI-2E family transporter [Saprospiraceae bacterium]
MKTWQKYTIAIVPILVIGVILYFFSDIVSYIIMAWVISMIGAPLFRLLNKFVKSGLAAGLTLSILFLFMILMIRLFVPPLFQQAKNLAGIDYEELIDGLEEPINDTKAWLVNKGLLQDETDTEIQKISEAKPDDRYITHVIDIDSLLNDRGDSLKTTKINLLVNIEHNEPEAQDTQLLENSYFNRLKNSVVSMLNPSKIPQLLSSLVGVFGGFVIALLSVLFIAFFFLKESGLFTRMVSSFVPNKQESKVSHAIEESSALLIRYFVGLCIQVLIITILTSVILKLFGFKSALLMAFCFAILNLIPYIGPIMGNLVGVLIVISSNLDVGFYDVMLPKVITAVVIFAVLQLLDNFILQPNIFSKSVKAHPLEIFIVVLMGAKLGGVLGMVLAIPAYTVLRVLAKVFFSEFEVVKKLTQGL